MASFVILLIARTARIACSDRHTYIHTYIQTDRHTHKTTTVTLSAHARRGLITAHYCSTHSNHSISLGHLRLSAITKEEIALKLIEGVTAERILDDIRDSVTGTVTRELLVNKQDIHNIKLKHNTEGIIRHKDDSKSVHVWTEEMKSLPYNPVLLYMYKAQGIPDPNNFLKEDDFLLVIQVEFQRDMLIKFGQNAICMDATHGTYAYDFNLITAVVIDEFGEGVPVFWAISNKQDTEVLVLVFNVVKQRSGNINPKWFMSDDAQQFFNAWKSVFGGKGCKKLLCAWHIDRSWKRSLKGNVSSTYNRIELYHCLMVLLQERNQVSFRVSLQKFLAFAGNTEPKFAQYFKDNYCNQ